MSETADDRPSSPASEVTETDRLPHLPADIIRIVLIHAVYDYSEYYRNELLTNACLVCREWCDVAQPLLLAEVSIHSGWRATNFGLLVLQDEARARMVSRLNYGWPSNWDISPEEAFRSESGGLVPYLTFLMERCINLEEMHVDALKVQLSEFQEDALDVPIRRMYVEEAASSVDFHRAASKLRKAKFSDCPAAFLNRTHLLSGLTSLSVNCQPSGPFGTAFRQPTFRLREMCFTGFHFQHLQNWRSLFSSSFGTLRTLELHNYTARCIHDVVSYVGERLQRLVVTFGQGTRLAGDEHSALWYIVRTCRNLRELVIWSEWICEPDFLEDLPPGLRILDISECLIPTSKLLLALDATVLQERWKVFLPAGTWGQDGVGTGPWTGRELELLQQVGSSTDIAKGTWFVGDKAYSSTAAA